MKERNQSARVVHIIDVPRISSHWADPKAELKHEKQVSRDVPWKLGATGVSLAHVDVSHVAEEILDNKSKAGVFPDSLQKRFLAASQTAHYRTK